MDRCLFVAFASSLAACFVDLGGGDTAMSGGSTATGAGESSGGDLPGTVTGADTSGSAETTDGPTTGAADGSTGLIEPLTCGDGVQDSNEDCDDGNNMSGDGCSADCLLEESLCGDERLDPGEQCDDGNLNDGDGCSAFCTLEVGCGDGMKLASEECDDGNSEPNDGCDDCQLQFLYAFVTAGQYTGALGGVGGADAICQMEATGVLPGSYRAWLASSPGDLPATRFTTVEGAPYRLPDQVTTIVGGFSGLNNDIMNPIDQTANGTPVDTNVIGCAQERSVWTGIDASGAVYADGSCDGWLSDSGSFKALSGYLDAVSAEWTAACLADCDRAQRLYCFQQAP